MRGTSPSNQPIKSNLRRERSQAITAKVDQLKERNEFGQQKRSFYMVDHVAIAGEGFQPQQAGISGHSVPALWLTIEEPPWLGRFFNCQP